MRRATHILPLIVAFWAFAGVGSAVAAPSGGVAITGIDAGIGAVTADLDQAKAMGAKVVRTELSWRHFEPAAAGQRDPGVLATLDATMQAAHARGLKVILLTDQTPCWTSTAPPEIRDRCAAGSETYPPADTAAYANMVAFIGARYQRDLAALEIWNEPDQANERYWAGPDKVGRYAAMLRATYPAVKRVAPRVPVLAGAIVGTNGAFLTNLFKAHIKGFYDGISVHFYDLPLLGLRTTRAVQRRFGDRKPLWLLEAGWNSCKPAAQGAEGQPCTTAGVQARNLRNLFALTRGTRYLHAITVYKLRDEGVDHFGALGADGRRKPAFAALRAAFRRPSRSTGLTLRVASRRVGVRVTGSGPEGDAYRLVVRISGALRYKALFRLDASNRYALTLPPQLGRTGLRVTVENLWSTGLEKTRRG